MDNILQMNAEATSASLNAGNSSVAENGVGDNLSGFDGFVEKFHDRVQSTGDADAIEIQKQALIDKQKQELGPSPWKVQNAVSLEGHSSADNVSLVEAMSMMNATFDRAILTSLGSQVISATTSTVKQLVRQS